MEVTPWRNVTVTGRNETAEQLEECEGLGAAAGGREKRGSLFPLLPLFPFLIRKLITLLLTNYSLEACCVCVSSDGIRPTSYSLLLIVERVPFQSCTTCYY